MADTLDVPGARLSYDVRGAGPVLLLIPGGPADGRVFGRIAPVLAARHTVVTYAPRGVGESTREDGAADIPIAVQADDARRVLAAVAGAPADVLGSSGGAATALELIARHPDRVRAVVAHEPPVVALLPDAGPLRARVEAIHGTYLAHGAGAAMAEFLVFAGFAPPGTPAPPVDGSADVALFLGHMLRPIIGYGPDAAALRAVSGRLRVGVGATSAGQVAHRTAPALAEALGTPPVHFPGGHAGFATDPEEFAEVLHATLAGLAAQGA